MTIKFQLRTRRALCEPPGIVQYPTNQRFLESQKMPRLPFVVLILALTINGGAVGQSPDGPTSRLNTYECEALPRPLRLSVQLLDNADRFLKFKDHFEKELRAAGAEITTNAPAILTFDVRTIREFQGESAGPLFQLRAGQENTNIGQDGTVFFRGNVWSNRSNSVLGGPKRQTGQNSLNQLQVTVNINRGTDGRCLWQGEVLHNLDGENADIITLRTLTILAGNLGKTVRNKALTIYP